MWRPWWVGRLPAQGAMTWGDDCAMCAWIPPRGGAFARFVPCDMHQPDLDGFVRQDTVYGADTWVARQPVGQHLNLRRSPDEPFGLPIFQVTSCGQLFVVGSLRLLLLLDGQWPVGFAIEER